VIQRSTNIYKYIDRNIPIRCNILLLLVDLNDVL